MTWPEFYGSLVLAMLISAFASGHRTCVIAAIVLACEYIFVNVAVGDDRFWAINPAGIGATLLGSMVLLLMSPSYRLAVLVGCHGLTMVIHFLADLTATTLAYSYEATINGIFGVQLLFVGGWGVWSAVRNWRSLGRRRALDFSATRATVARRRAF